jgi:hypothetical protein
MTGPSLTCMVVVAVAVATASARVLAVGSPNGGCCCAALLAFAIFCDVAVVVRG